MLTGTMFILKIKIYIFPIILLLELMKSKFLKKTQKDFCIKYIVLGSDAFNELHLWKDYIQLIKSYHFIVINRIGNKLNKNQTNNNKLHIIKKLDDINSSQIRNAIRLKKPINKYVSKEIEKYITKTNLYQ